MAYSVSSNSRRSDARRGIKVMAWCCALAVLLLLPFLLSEYRLFQVGLIASTSLVAAGLVIVTGVAGQVSLAQAAFVALGAYGSSLLAQDLGITQWIGIPVSAAAAGAVGYLLGLLTLRMGGHYLALATMALTAIVQVVIVHWQSLTNGALGLAVVPLTIGGRPLTSGMALFYVVVPVTVAMFALATNLLDSRIGRAFAALRQSEIAASTLGINVLHYKALAFALSAVFGAIGGGLQALQTTYLDPQSFGIVESVLFIAIIVIGGFRNMAGAVLGSAVFIIIPTMLGTFQAYRGLAFALLLLGTIVLFPGGLIELARAGLAKGLARFGGRAQ
jgi:branched-chain amino acid transport system permease protein